jgi:hypothetical protein
LCRLREQVRWEQLLFVIHLTALPSQARRFGSRARQNTEEFINPAIRIPVLLMIY